MSGAQDMHATPGGRITRTWVVNGERYRVTCDPLAPLLHALREGAGVTGAKEGCGEGECGSCLVLLEGDPVPACLVPAGQVPDGAGIRTAESLAESPLGRAIVSAFAERAAVQCGFCFPGVLVAAYAYLRDTPEPAEQTAREALSGNLCRCTGYAKIIAAVLAAGEQLSFAERSSEPADTSTSLGASEAADTSTSLGASEAADTSASLGTSAPADAGAPSAFHAPAELAEALALRARMPHAVLLAGGTDLMVGWQSARRVPVLTHAEEPPVEQRAPTAVITLANIAELRGITLDAPPASAAERVRIGAMTAVDELARSALIAARAPALARAARELGARPIRLRATVGGNLVNASPAADLVPPLLAADAVLELASPRGRRALPLARFHRGYKEVDLRPDEILAAIHVPLLGAGQREGFRKLGTRRAQSIAKVCAAVRLSVSAGRIVGIAIAAGSVAPTAIRLHRTEERLRDAQPSAAWLAQARGWIESEVHPIDDVRSTADYRRAQTAILVTDLITELLAGVGMEA